MSASKKYISTALHSLLGFSDSSLTSFLLSAAQTAPSPAAIESILKEYDVTPSSNDWGDVRKFCKELYRHLHPAPVVKKVAPPPPPSNKYDLVEEEDNYVPEVNRKKTKKEKKEKKGKKRDRGDSADSGSDTGTTGTTVVKPVHSRLQTKSTTEPEPVVSKEIAEELERAKDERERDEFAARLAKKDSNKDKGGKKEDDEESKDTNTDSATIKKLMKGETVTTSDNNTVSLRSLREQSRQSYMEKREERELLLLEQAIKDEEELFAGQKMSTKEIKDLAMKKEILRMAKNRSGEQEEEEQGYRVPEGFIDDEGMIDKEKKDKVLTQRYKETVQEKSEMELWEEGQTNAAISGIGKSKKKEDDGYDFVFDDAIDFVVTETKKGKNKKGKEVDKVERDEPEEAPAPGLTEHQKILVGRKKLPVFAYREEFLAAVVDHQVLIIVGETGSGKTTQTPQYLHEAGYSKLGRIACTQPRRVAAMSVAARVAQEMDVKLGHEVGYSIRFEDNTSDKTVIQYMTDGMLLRSFLTEPDLKSYSCLIIDEAHERTLHTDILFGLVKDIVRFRKDLKLIISSATLDAEKFSSYLDDAPIFMIPGRMFPVDILYTKQPEADYVDAAVVTTLQIHISQPIGSGDVLIFLTGQEEIEQCAETLTLRTKGLGARIPELIICPVYANLPADQQAKIFMKCPPNARKVVIATNIAETSLTIDGVCYVIDSGFAKQKSYNPKTGMESLTVTPISQAAANQRSGRAGRTAPGKCFRLFTAWSFKNELEANTIPEIQRTNMGNVVLQLKALGINDLLHFDFMDPPPAECLMRAFENLYALGALNDRGELTKLGRKMAEFPLEPMLSKCVIIAEKYGCVKEVLSMVAMLSIGASVFYRPKEKAVHADTARLNFARGGGGDQISLLRCYTEWEDSGFQTSWCFENYVQNKSMKKARDVRDQIAGLCERVEIEESSVGVAEWEKVLKAFTAGFFFNVSKLARSGDYTTVKQRHTVYIHPSSCMAKDEIPADWLVYFELAFTTKEYMRQVAPIKGEWLTELAPHYYNEGDVEEAVKKKQPKMRKN